MANFTLIAGARERVDPGHSGYSTYYPQLTVSDGAQHVILSMHVGCGDNLEAKAIAERIAELIMGERDHMSIDTSKMYR